MIDVLVVNFLSGEDTLRAVECVSGPGVHVAVYDNSGELLDAPGLEVHGDGRNHFYAEASNRLFDSGSAELVLLLNPDVLLAYDDLLELSRRLETHAGAWGVVPRLVDERGQDQNYLRRLPTTGTLAAELMPPLRRMMRRAWRRYRCLDLDLRQQQVVEQPAAACLLLRRALLGGHLFDARFPLFFNDVDLARRLSAVGDCLYLPDIVARHKGGASIDAGRRSGVPVAQMYQDAVLEYGSHVLHARPLLLPLWWVRRAALCFRRHR